MKKLSQIFEAKIDIQDETINFIDKSDLKKYLESIITHYEDMIEEGNKIILFDHNTLFNEKLNKINGYELKSFSYREATLNECLEHLTPDQFKELYGNIILKGE